MRISDWSSDVCSSDLDGVVIFTNSVGGGPLRAEIRRAVAAAEHWPQSRLSINVPAVTLPPAALAERAGTYVVTPAAGVNATRLRIDAAPVAFRVSVAGDRLVLADTRPGTMARRWDERLVGKGGVCTCTFSG